VSELRLHRVGFSAVHINHLWVRFCITQPAAIKKAIGGIGASSIKVGDDQIELFLKVTGELLNEGNEHVK
jgi:hypothetical protein